MNVVITQEFLGAEDDADLVEWLVAEGDTVSLGQPLAALETAKSTVEFESPAAGVISLRADEGEVVETGATIATIA